MRFFEWLAAIRRSQVEKLRFPAKGVELLNTVTKTSWAMSSASARVAHHPQHQVEHLVAVKANDLVESLLVAFAQASNEKSLGEVHR